MPGDHKQTFRWVKAHLFLFYPAFVIRQEGSFSYPAVQIYVLSVQKGKFEKTVQEKTDKHYTISLQQIYISVIKFTLQIYPIPGKFVSHTLLQV